MQGLYNYLLCGGGGDVHAKVSCTCAGDINIPLQSTFYLRVVGWEMGPRPLGSGVIDDLLVPPGKAYTLMTDYLING